MILVAEFDAFAQILKAVLFRAVSDEGVHRSTRAIIAETLIYLQELSIDHFCHRVEPGPYGLAIVPVNFNLIGKRLFVEFSRDIQIVNDVLFGEWRRAFDDIALGRFQTEERVVQFHVKGDVITNGSRQIRGGRLFFWRVIARRIGFRIKNVSSWNVDFNRSFGPLINPDVTTRIARV